MDTVTLPVWPYAFGGPSSQGILRGVAADFIVVEQLKFIPAGTGEHVFLKLQKTGENTEFVARLLARFAGVRQRDVSYAGLKDRHAITTQWFSLWMPGKADLDWSAFETPTLKIIEAVRHTKKLKRGVLAANEFSLRISNWQGNVADTERQLALIKLQGVPNYFGEQRFGNQGQNVNKAMAMFTGAKVGREQRSLYLSAVRSFLFNHILSRRVQQNSWNRALNGDVMMLAGTHSFFHVDTVDAEITARIGRYDVHPTGTLWGVGESEVTGDAALNEREIIERYPKLAQGLTQEKLEHDRRALRVIAADLTWQFPDAHTLELHFSLPAGSYATAVLREVIDTTAAA